MSSRPAPPEKPLPFDCCDSGCEVCVFDLYAEALQRYQVELARWEAAQQKSEREDLGAGEVQPGPNSRRGA